MKHIQSFHLYLIAIALTVAGNFFIPRDSILYYPFGVICIAIAFMALRKQFKSK